MVTVIAEAYMQVRGSTSTTAALIPTDPDLTYNGHSIGHWDGDKRRGGIGGFHKTHVGMNMGSATARRCTSSNAST